MSDLEGSEGSDETPEPTDSSRSQRLAPILIAGCVSLAAMGLLLVVLATPLVLDPHKVRCEVARSLIEDANDNDETFDDVDLGGRTVADLDCAEAAALASQIPVAEDGDRTVSVPSRSGVRTQGLITSVLGLGQIAAGGATTWTRARVARNVAIGFAFVSIIIPVFGLASFVVVALVVYMLGFSAPSRERWGRFGRNRRLAAPED